MIQGDFFEGFISETPHTYETRSPSFCMALEDLGFPSNWKTHDLREIMNAIKKDEKLSKKANAFMELAHEWAETRLIKGQAFHCSKDIYEHFYSRLLSEKQELFIVVLLNNKHEYMKEVLITKGLLSKSLVHPRECLAPAIEARAGAIICLHNHPSGSSKPSQDDIQITRRLYEACKLIGIPLLDHLVFGNHNYFSFADEGLLSP